MAVHKELGLKVMVARKRAGLTQGELAEKVNCHPNWISYIERGTQRPGKITAIKIANALNQSLEELFGDEYK